MEIPIGFNRSVEFFVEFGLSEWRYRDCYTEKEAHSWHFHFCAIKVDFDFWYLPNVKACKEHRQFEQDLSPRPSDQWLAQFDRLSGEIGYSKPKNMDAVFQSEMNAFAYLLESRHAMDWMFSTAGKEWLVAHHARWGHVKPKKWWQRRSA